MAVAAAATVVAELAVVMFVARGPATELVVAARPLVAAAAREPSEKAAGERTLPEGQNSVAPEQEPAAASGNLGKYSNYSAIRRFLLRTRICARRADAVFRALQAGRMY